jgi:hypothetical protein
MDSFKRNKAIFTIQKDEDFFLPIWYNYYSSFFDSEDIYILNHNSEHFNIQQYLRNKNLKQEANIINIHNNAIFDHIWMRDIVTQFQHFLLNSYNRVLFTEIDEIVATLPDGKYGNLKDYIDNFKKPFVRTLGYNVQHLAGIESDIDLQKPLLKQRKYWYKEDHYNKPLLATEPLWFAGGFHTLMELDFHDKTHVDPNLLLIHLHGIDLKQMYIRKKKNDSSKWCKKDLDAGTAPHNLPIPVEALKGWLINTVVPDNWEIIPESVKNII